MLAIITNERIFVTFRIDGIMESEGGSNNLGPDNIVTVPRFQYFGPLLPRF